ncbi:tautomerase family protein [Modestobacter sp. I12A-02662]
MCEDTGPGLERTDDLVVFRVFQQEGSEARKRAVYAGLAKRLERSPV